MDWEIRSATDVRFEMSNEKHKRLLHCLSKIDGKFLLSGYPSNLYAHYAKRYGWNRHEKQIDNKASSKKKKEMKTECLWANF